MRDRNAPLITHLEELRRCLLTCIFAVIIGGAVSYFYINKILSLFTRFVTEKIIFIAPQEAFVTYVKISLFSGILLASPIIIFQIWHFVEKALTNVERNHIIIYIFVSFFLFMAGLVFCYYITLPWSLNFLLSFRTEKIVPMITLTNLTTFCITFLLSFGIIFELPLVVTLLTQIGFIDPAFLRKNRKYAILLIFILSAILTPPDTLTQIFLAIPLLALYEIGIFLSEWVNRSKKLK